MQVNFNVSAKAGETLEREAGARGYSRTAYAAMLFEAAFAARFGRENTDFELKAVIEMVLVLWGSKKETATIAAAVGLSEPSVERILKTWRDEITKRPGGEAVRNAANAVPAFLPAKNGRGSAA